MLHLLSLLLYCIHLTLVCFWCVRLCNSVDRMASRCTSRWSHVSLMALERWHVRETVKDIIFFFFLKICILSNWALYVEVLPLKLQCCEPLLHGCICGKWTKRNQGIHCGVFETVSLFTLLLLRRTSHYCRFCWYSLTSTIGIEWNGTLRVVCGNCPVSQDNLWTHTNLIFFFLFTWLKGFCVWINRNQTRCFQHPHSSCKVWLLCVVLI